MIILEFTEYRISSLTNVPEWEILARVTLDPIDKTYSIEGDGGYFDTSIAVIEPETGINLTFASNPLLWARNLHHAYRSQTAVRCQEIIDA